MNTRFQSELNHIKADDALIKKTEMYLREKLAENKQTEIIKIPKRRFNPVKSLAKAACIIFILAGGSTGTYAYYKTPVAYLSLDINPSIELGINAFDKVVSVEGYNADGRTVLNGIDVTGTNIEEAVSTVITSAASNGFIENDGSTVVSLTSETDNINISNKLKAEAETGVNKALKENGKKAVIYKDNVALNFRIEARELNITPGKLNLINKLVEVNPSADENQYKEAKVREIIKAIKESPENVASSKDETVTSKKESTSVSKDTSSVSIKESTAVSSKESTLISDNKDAVIKSNTASGSEDKNNPVNKNEIAVIIENKDNKNNGKENINSGQEAAADKNQVNMQESNKKDAADKKESKVKKRHNKN